MNTEFSKALIFAGPRIHAVGLVVNVNEGSNLKLNLMIRLLRELKIDMKHIVIIVTHGDSLLPKPLPQELRMRYKLRCERLEGHNCLTKLLSNVQNRYIVVENTQICERNFIIGQLLGHIASIAQSPMTNDTFKENREWWEEQTAKRMKEEQEVSKAKDELLHLKLQHEETDLRELRSKCTRLEEEHSTVTSHHDKIDNIRQTLEEMRQVERDANNHTAMIAEANGKLIRLEVEISDLRDQDDRLTELEKKLRQCFEEKVKCFTSACSRVIHHREGGIDILNKAAAEIDKLKRDATAAKVAGYSGSIAGGAIFTVGVGLLLGGITAPAAIPLLVIGGVTGGMGSAVALGGTVGQMIRKSKIMSSAKEWMKENKTLCKDLIEKHDTLTTEHSHIMEVFPSSNTQLPQGITEVSNIVSTWKGMINFSAKDATKFVAVAARGGLGVAQGVLETVDAGVEVSAIAVKVAAKTAGGVAIGLSALVMVLDLTLLVKSGYDLDRLRKGHHSKAAKALIDIAEAVRDENNLLREAHSQCGSVNDAYVINDASEAHHRGNNSHTPLVVCNPSSFGNDELLHNGTSADLESHSNHPDEVLATTSGYVAPQSCEDNEGADHDSDDQSMVSLSHSQCTSGGSNGNATLVMCNPSSLGNDERLHNGTSADLESHSNHPDEVLATTSGYVAPQSCEDNEGADHDSDDQSMVSLSHSQCTSGGSNGNATLVMCNPSSLGNDERLHNGTSADLESHSNHPDEVLATTSGYVAPQSCEDNESADHDSNDESIVSLEASEDEGPSDEVHLQSTGSITSCSQLQSDSDSACDSSSTLNISMDKTSEMDAPDTNNGRNCIIF